MSEKKFEITKSDLNKVFWRSIQNCLDFMCL